MKKHEVRVYEDGTKSWWLNGKLHREDGPAVECPDGTKAWWLNDKRHREDGPAVECPNGFKSWWLNGKRHRGDGPAIERSDGSKEWWLDGKEVSETEVLGSSCTGKTVTIDGVEYTLVRKA